MNGTTTATTANRGFGAHCQRAARFYEQRQQVMVAAADRRLRGLAKWHVPEAGMFSWLELPIADAKSLIGQKAAAANVLLVPGQAFGPLNQPLSFVRASFSTASNADLGAAMERLGATLIRSELVL